MPEFVDRVFAKTSLKLGQHIRAQVSTFKESRLD
jgi:hypothetical protein